MIRLCHIVSGVYARLRPRKCDSKAIDSANAQEMGHFAHPSCQSGGRRHEWWQDKLNDPVFTAPADV
jgi:hypothetical protein